MLRRCSAMRTDHYQDIFGLWGLSEPDLVAIMVMPMTDEEYLK